MALNKIKIISDGIGFGSKVVDLETGSEVENVTAIKINIGLDDVNRADLSIICPELEVIAEVEPQIFNIDDFKELQEHIGLILHRLGPDHFHPEAYRILTNFINKKWFDKCPQKRTN